ncbi:MAG: hypothetical protein A2W26_05190 [Acidobacteria bacterium RBG_16_64_8]|nr:MAG: hypothetical protein A2W26_05190 [Acidobacteria bacterium RBG_16_64_8]
MSDVVLRLHDVAVHFPVVRRLFASRIAGWIRALDGVTVEVQRGETLGIVGESGCGKTTVLRVILRIVRPTAGWVVVDGQDVHVAKGQQLREFRRKVQAVFQDPYSSLNSRMRVDRIVSEPLEALSSGRMVRDEVRGQVMDALESVGLRSEHAELYPHQFSGGQRQRIAIARAIAPRPAVLLLDEPTSALDVSVRAQILNLLRDIQRAHNLTYVIVSHDLGAVRYLSTNIAVMYLGRVVEVGPSPVVCSEPLHPYTQVLMVGSERNLDASAEPALMEGEVPSPMAVPSGCSFHTRCPYAMPRCSVQEPALQHRRGREVACHLY